MKTAALCFLFSLVAVLAMVPAALAQDAGPSAEVSAELPKVKSLTADESVAAIPDPVEQPGTFYEKVRGLWRSGAIVPAVLLVLAGLVVAGRKRIAWLNQGKRAVYVAAAGVALGMLAEAAIGGTTPNLNMWIAAISSALLYYAKADASDVT